MAGKSLSLFLPRGAAYWLAENISRLKLFFSRLDSRILSYNIKPVNKSASGQDKYPLKVMINFAYYLVDFFRFRKVDSGFIKKHVKFSGVDFLKKLQESKKKIIILSAHLGNYELGVALAASLGYKICALALPHKDRRLNDFFNKQRGMFGIEVASTGMGVKKCFQALSENKILALVGDRKFSDKGEKVNMFGRTCLLPRGPAILSLRTGAYIVPSFLVRENKYNYRLIFNEPIAPFSDNVKKTEDRIIQEYAAVLEKYIAEYPEQWYMFEKYWI